MTTSTETATTKVDRVDALYYLLLSQSSLSTDSTIYNVLAPKYKQLVEELIQSTFMADYLHLLSEKEIDFYCSLLIESANSDIRNYRVSIVCSLQTIERMVRKYHSSNYTNDNQEPNLILESVPPCLP